MSEEDAMEDARQEREWKAQELALHEEHVGQMPGSGDARVDEYRVIARVLRNPRLDSMPADFAARTAARIEHSSSVDDSVERWLQFGLVTSLFAVCLWVTAAVIVPSIQSPGSVFSWLAAAGGCVALTWGLETWGDRSSWRRLTKIYG